MTAGAFAGANASSRIPSNQAVPRPLPYPTRNGAIRTRPSSGAWKASTTSVQSGIAPMARSRRDDAAVRSLAEPDTSRTPAHRSDRGRLVRTQPSNRYQPPGCSETSCPSAVSDGSSADTRRARRPSWTTRPSASTFAAAPYVMTSQPSRRVGDSNPGFRSAETDSSPVPDPIAAPINTSVSGTIPIVGGLPHQGNSMVGPVNDLTYHASPKARYHPEPTPPRNPVNISGKRSDVRRIRQPRGLRSHTLEQPCQSPTAGRGIP